MAKTTSKIEKAIDALQDYIENCKTVPLTSSKIYVERETIEDLIRDLRDHLPEEIERYRKVISNQEAIEKEAKAKANQMLQNVQDKSSELISENEITIRAQQEANDLMNTAAERAQAVYDEAVAQGDAYRAASQQYLTDMLQNIQGIIINCLETTQKQTNKFLENLGGAADQIQANINDLTATEEPVMEDVETIPVDASIFEEEVTTNGEASIFTDTEN